jgi:hypothetical protein
MGKSRVASRYLRKDEKPIIPHVFTAGSKGFQYLNPLTSAEYAFAAIGCQPVFEKIFETASSGHALNRSSRRPAFIFNRNYQKRIDVRGAKALFSNYNYEVRRSRDKLRVLYANGSPI